MTFYVSWNSIRNLNLSSIVSRGKGVKGEHMSTQDKSNRLVSEAQLNNTSHAAKRMERRILRDILLCAVLTVLFSSASSLLSLQDAVAQWVGRPEIREVEGFVPVLIYAVWMIGIFTRRRLYDLISAMRERAAIEAELSTARTVAAVGRMAAGVAHDFNNLMTVIGGRIELARMDDNCPASVLKLLSPAEQAVGKAARMAAQLMRLGGRKPEPKSDLDINEIVSGMMQVLKHLTKREDVILETFLNPDGCRILASQGYVEQVILNLVANACEASEASSTVAIETKRFKADDQSDRSGLKMPPGDYIELRVRDAGAGIDPQVVEQIFEPYFTTKKTGTGLGLATVRSIVEECKGALDVRSILGEGTTVAVYWPVLQ